MPSNAYIAGAFEHPARHLPDTTLIDLHTQVALGALADAGLTLDDVDGLISTPDAPGMGVVTLADHLGTRNIAYMDTTETGGSSYLVHVAHAAAAIAAGMCSVVLITAAGKARSSAPKVPSAWDEAPDLPFESACGTYIAPEYALAARRHMHEFGTTSAQLAEVKVAASLHAQHNPNAVLREVVTVEQVLESPMISDPLHKLDCCLNTDGGGALVVVSSQVARRIARQCISVLGHGCAPKGAFGDRIDITSTGATYSGPRAYEMAGVRPADIDYCGVYDSFTITVLEQIEDLGFCDKGKGGPFIAEGALRAPDGPLPTNSDGGGLCNNHPGARGSMPKLVEAVRQLRGEAHPAVQVPDCEIALVNGTGGSIATRMGSATVILSREDA